MMMTILFTMHSAHYCVEKCHVRRDFFSRTGLQNSRYNGKLSALASTFPLIHTIYYWSSSAHFWGTIPAYLLLSVVLPSSPTHLVPCVHCNTTTTWLVIAHNIIHFSSLTSLWYLWGFAYNIKLPFPISQPKQTNENTGKKKR